MKKIALVVNNTVDLKTNTWKELKASQNGEVKRPAVYILDTETLKLTETYFIAAETQEEINFMYENKFFFTTCIDPNHHMKVDGTVFYGVEGYSKDRVFIGEKEKAVSGY